MTTSDIATKNCSEEYREDRLHANQKLKERALELEERIAELKRAIIPHHNTIRRLIERTQQ